MIEKIHNLTLSSHLSEALALTLSMMEKCLSCGNTSVKAWFERYLTVIYFYKGDYLNALRYLTVNRDIFHKNITGVEALPDIEVPMGTAKANLAPPAKVKATLDDSSTIDASVLWDNFTPAYDSNTPGTYTLSGTLYDLPYGVDNPQGVKATVQVIVQDTRPHAPVLDADGFEAGLTAIWENTFDSMGNTVGEIVSDGSIIDPVGNAREAIAVTSVDNTHGKWQFSLDGGTTWLDVTNTTGTNVDLTSASLLLDENSRLRFVPDADWYGRPTFSYRVWRDESAALRLDGVDDFVRVEGLGGPYSSITFEGCIRPESFSSNSGNGNYLMATEGSGSALQLGAIKMNFVQQGAKTALQTSVVDPVDGTATFDYDFNRTLGKWTHVAVTINKSTGEFKLYVNGVYQETKTGDISGLKGLYPSTMTLGAWKNLENTQYFFNGVLSDVRLWSAERSAEEIAGHMARNSLQGDEAGLIANWQLTGDSGAIARDSGPNGKDGSIEGGATLKSSSGLTADTTSNGGTTLFSEAVETASIDVNHKLPEPPPVMDAVISPTSAGFDKKVDAQADIAVAMTLNGNTLSAITDDTDYTLNGDPQSANPDYTVTGDDTTGYTVTIAKSYLVSRPLGTTRLTFDFTPHSPGWQFRSRPAKGLGLPEIQSGPGRDGLYSRRHSRCQQ